MTNKNTNFADEYIEEKGELKMTEEIETIEEVEEMEQTEQFEGVKKGKHNKREEMVSLWN